MAFGIMPSKNLLKEYGLVEYEGICEAIEMGDVGKLKQAISLNEDFLIKKGVMSTMDRIRLLTIRNFIKRMHTAIKNSPEL